MYIHPPSLSAKIGWKEIGDAGHCEFVMRDRTCAVVERFLRRSKLEFYKISVEFWQILYSDVVPLVLCVTSMGINILGRRTRGWL